MLAVEHAAQPARLRANVARRNIDKTYTAQLATTTRTRWDAYRVRYLSYINSGYIDPNPDKQFFDKYDYQPSSHTVVIYEAARPVASVRVSFFSCDSLELAPVGETYPNEVGALLAGYPKHPRGAQAVEINRLVRSPECENNQGLVFLLLRAAGYLAIHENVSLLMSCVRENHVPFYRRIGCYSASDIRPYPYLRFSTRLLCCPRANYENACAAFPIMDPNAGPSDSFDGFMSGRAVTMPLAFGA